MAYLKKSISTCHEATSWQILTDHLGFCGSPVLHPTPMHQSPRTWQSIVSQTWMPTYMKESIYLFLDYSSHKIDHTAYLGLPNCRSITRIEYSKSNPKKSSPELVNAQWEVTRRQNWWLVSTLHIHTCTKKEYLMMDSNMRTELKVEDLLIVENRSK